MTMADTIFSGEYPPASSLLTMMGDNPLPVIKAEGVDPTRMDEPTVSAVAVSVISRLNAAIAEGDHEALKACFFPSQAWWKDSLALTYHLRTFKTSETIVAALLETKKLRSPSQFMLDGKAQYMQPIPSLKFVDVGFTFRTESPAASCSGKMLLLPREDHHGSVQWTIWVLSTRLESLDLHPQDESLLLTSRRQLSNAERLETDVFIIGAGNAAIALAARLKALNVDSVMIDKNSKVGDNWGLRYKSMRFHVPTAFCELPFMTYGEHLQAPHLLSRDDLADQVRQYVDAFQLNVINSAQIKSTVYDASVKEWTVKFETNGSLCTAVAKHVVMATGVGSQVPYIPSITPSEISYRGINMHSVDYQCAKDLAERGVKSVLLIGSGNTAFDILEECHHAGLDATMNVRSPTFICPVEYVLHPHSLGAYNAGVQAADRLFLSLPTVIDSIFAKGLMVAMASSEPHRYDALAEAGFPVLDNTHPECALMSTLLERAGGHYMDTGATDLIARKAVGLKAGVEPTALTESGVQFSDGSTADVDAVIWCTGFADKDVRQVAADILGGNEVQNGEEGKLGARELASRLDTTWGLDSEGEVRGMWKRHERLDEVPFWVMGGYTQQHRYHSQTLALQIKAHLEGILPKAYRDTPGTMK